MQIGHAFVAVFLMCSLSARADGDVFAVLPTEGTGDVAREAALASSMMVSAIERESLALSPPAAVEAARLVHAAACAQSNIACARLVGRDVGATKVIVSELWGADNSWELRMTLVDIKAGTEPAPLQAFTTTQREEIGRIAEREALTLIGRGASGWLSMTLQGADTGTLIVDGMSVGAFPFPSPVRLREGRHNLEVRTGDASPWQGQIEIASEATTTVGVHLDGNRVVLDSSGGPSPLVVAGIVGAGVGVVGLVVGAVGLGLESSALEAFANKPSSATNSSVSTARTIAGIGLIGGAVLIVAGTAVAVVGAME